MNHKLKILLGLSLFWGTHTYAGSQVLLMDANARLEAEIARDYLNRIGATNDRITQIFGDEATYAIQVDENKGQIFIKPTEANGLKPISLTLITENGHVQDLTLKPTDKGASTVILKGEKKAEGSESSSSSSSKVVASAQFLEMTLPVQEKLIRAMKMLVSGQFPMIDRDGGDRQCPSGVSLSHKSTYQVGPFKGNAYEISNGGEELVDLEEKDFFKMGDLAISFGNRVLKANKSTTLWVIQR